MNNPICYNSFGGNGVGCYGTPSACSTLSDNPEACVNQGCEYKGSLHSSLSIVHSCLYVAAIAAITTILL